MFLFLPAAGNLSAKNKKPTCLEYFRRWVQERLGCL
jgi:hypothetical protein